MNNENNYFKEASLLFEAHLRKNSLKLTSQRLTILNEFLKSEEHFNAEDLFRIIRLKNPKIGYSTVYRTLKLLKDCAIAKEHNFGDGTIRYENDFKKPHHDHLICIQCDNIIEFECPEIEELQNKVAKSMGFSVVDHRLEIYGRCIDPKKCKNKAGEAKDVKNK